VLAGPTESEGVGAFVESLAKQRGESRESVVPEFFENARPTSLLKRFATTAEVASMIIYLCSEATLVTTAAGRVSTFNVISTCNSLPQPQFQAGSSR